MNRRAVVVELDAVGAQLGGARDPGDQRHGDDAGDEQPGDGDAVGLVDDVLDQRVEQDGGEQRRTRPRPALPVARRPRR